MNADIARIARALDAQQKELDIQILRTQTGPEREALTEANIHLMQAIAVLQIAAS
jgi:hypothetical protein